MMWAVVIPTQGIRAPSKTRFTLSPERRSKWMVATFAHLLTSLIDEALYQGIVPSACTQQTSQAGDYFSADCLFSARTR